MSDPKESIPPREKFRRARVLHDWSLERCDEAMGAAKGRAQSWARGRATPRREDLTPLAKAWGIDVEWFYDGANDAPPFGETPTVAPVPTLPLMGHLPARDSKGSRQGLIPVRVAFPLPQGSHYRRYANTLGGACLRRGDLLLVAPTDLAFGDTLAVVEVGGISDVYRMDGIGDAIRPTPLVDGQAQPAEGEWALVGIVVELQRPMTDGLTVALEREMGLTAEDLRLAAGE